MTRPEPGEYHDYYRTYVELVPEGDVVDTLRAAIGETMALLRGLPEARANQRYAPGKWTVKEVIAHLADTERTFTFRAFWFARGGPGELASFDQDPFVAQSFANARTLDELLDDFEAVRAATVSLYAGMPDSVTTRTGIASDCSFSVRTFPYITAGHEIHHRNQLRDRYGLG